MCVILFAPKEIRPSLETLRLCERTNRHGGGMAWREGNAVEWFKTNDVTEIERRARQIKGELVIHFRFASVGAVCDELRHPFPITRRARLDQRGRTKAVLFQNGTWHRYQQELDQAQRDGWPSPDGPMSDARAAAFLVSRYGHQFLARCGPSRWVYFSGAETVCYGQWLKHEGIYFSNLRWLRSPAPSPPSPRRIAPQGNNSEALNLELWNLDGVTGYWDRLRRHNAILREQLERDRVAQKVASLLANDDPANPK